VDRVRTEYLEMPGMTLSAIQIQRLCGMETSDCRAVLEALVEAGFLSSTADGIYARATDTSRGRATSARTKFAAIALATSRRRAS